MNEILFFEISFHFVGAYHLLFERIGTRFRRFHHFNYFSVSPAVSGLQCCYNLLCHSSNYLISLCKVTFFNIGLYFLNSNLSGVFFLFLVVIYREVPGIPDSLCSVHSRITCTLFPLAFFAIFSDFKHF